MLKKPLLWLIAISVINSFSFLAVASDSKINSAEIVQATTKAFLSCSKWKISGACFWLECKGFYCTIQTSPLVEHYTPDAIVPVYQDATEYPFEDMKWLASNVAKTSKGVWGYESKGGSRSGIKKQGNNVMYRQADVIGSPASSIVADLLSGTGFSCESNATPYVPYFLSGLNPQQWYLGLMDAFNPAYWTPGMREVGEREDGQNKGFLLTDRWGGVIPRTGMLMQKDHYRGASVIAQRAIDVVINGGGLYLKQGFNGEETGYWPSLKTDEADSTFGYWQQLKPRTESSCGIMGELKGANKSSSLARDKYSASRSKSGDYVYQYWGKKKCCEEKGVFLYKVEL